jgi:hypothetical protein
VGRHCAFSNTGRSSNQNQQGLICAREPVPGLKVFRKMGPSFGKYHLTGKLMQCFALYARRVFPDQTLVQAVGQGFCRRMSDAANLKPITEDGPGKPDIFAIFTVNSYPDRLSSRKSVPFLSLWAKLRYQNL